MISRSQLLFAVPTALGGVVAAVIGGVLLWPQWQQVQVGRSRATELREIEAQLPLMAQQLTREQQGAVQARQQQGVVLQLIAGSGSLATFMAQVDRLAALSGVKLSLYEPLVAAAPPSDPKAAGKPKRGAKDEPPPPPADPLLLAPGVAKEEVLLSASGRYPALLAFMRQLEKLRVLVVQSNLQLASDVQQQAGQPAQRAQGLPPIQLKMSVATYYRSPQ